MEQIRIFNDIFFNINNEIEYYKKLLSQFIDNNFMNIKTELKHNYDDFIIFMKNIINKICDIKLTITNLLNELNNNINMKSLFESKIIKLKNKYKYLTNDVIIIKDKINKKLKI